jgi:hypothetical protein
VSALKISVGRLHGPSALELFTNNARESWCLPG